MASSIFSIYLFFALGLVLLEVGAGLRCRVDHDEHTQEGFQDVVRACRSEDFRQDQDSDQDKPTRNNNSWQWKPQWSLDIPRFPTKNRNNNQDNNGNRESNDEEEENNRDNRNRWRGNRGRRSSQRPHFSGFSNHTSGRQGEGSTLDDIDPCMVHCIFRQMQMLNKNEQPDKQSVTRVMTAKLRNHELREFLRDAISECFDKLEYDNQDSKCAVSKSFAMCLEQKGQQNCDDWDEELKRPRNRGGGMNKRLG